MAKSSLGKARIRLYAALLICNLIVFALSAHVNSFHGFFYVADQMPFAMSIITFLVVGLTLFGDMRGANPFLSRPAIELPFLAVLSLFWLCFNAFSSSRWRFIQGADCGTIPAGQDFSAVAIWCKETQALRSFVWIEWVILVFTFIYLIRYVTKESSRGNKRVWSTSLARTAQNHPQMKYINRPSAAFSSGRASSFMSGERESEPSIYTPQSMGADFERQSQEHWQNTQHAHSNSVQSYNSYQNHPYQQQQEQQQYPQQQYQQQYQQQQQQQQQQYQQPSAQPGQYMFNGYGYAQ
ncbi:hypothetical protein AURDEDRAFT_110458 [Auricularia subglabra TFB-10046 SS5]|nr:hypothetical protein AURDEDRAFT_110458 [Auricularia subglabra TFB-10046 SS5]